MNFFIWNIRLWLFNGIRVFLCFIIKIVTIYFVDSFVLMYFVFEDRWCNIYWTTASQNWGNSLYLPSFNIGHLLRSILIKSKVIDWVKKEVLFIWGGILPVTSLDFKGIFVRMLQFCWFVEEKGIWVLNNWIVAISNLESSK